MATIRSTRRFVLTLGVAFASAALTASAAVDSALAGLIPADATVVSGVNVTQAKVSSFGRFVLSQMQLDDKGFQAFIAETGFDPRRDLSDLMVVTIGTGDKTEAVVLGRGVFNPGRVFNTAQTHGATITTYNGIDILSHNGGALAFVDASIAIAGHDKAVRAAIDQRTASAKLPEAVTKKMQELSANNDAWFYSTASPADFFAGKFTGDQNLGGAMRDGLMQSVLQAAGGIKFGEKDIKVAGEAITRSDKDATALADVFRFLSQIVQNNNNNNPKVNDAAALLSKLQLSTDANVMKISLAIPEEVLERMFSGRAAARVARVARR
jgi:hypothetical protein